MVQLLLNMKKVAIVIAFRDFRDVEYFIPRDILIGAGFEIFNVSTKKGLAIGADGGEVNIDLTPDEFQAENFDAVVFIGGPGMAKNLDNQDLQKMAQDAAATGKPLGAICIAPALLAKAGVLKGKKVTVWSNPMDKSAIKILKDGGAVYQDERILVDGKIVTASGPDAAWEFGEALTRLLK